MASVGAWSVHRAAGDILALAAIGLLGFGLRRAGCPLAPVMIGFMLGPAADMHLRRALAVGDGAWTDARPQAGRGPDVRRVRAAASAGPSLWRRLAAGPRRQIDGVQGTGLH